MSGLNAGQMTGVEARPVRQGSGTESQSGSIFPKLVSEFVHVLSIKGIIWPILAHHIVAFMPDPLLVYGSTKA